MRLHFRRSSVFGSHALGFSQSVDSVVLLLEFGFNSVQASEDCVVVLFVIRAQSTSVHLARKVINRVLIRSSIFCQGRDDSHLRHESPVAH